VKKAKNMKKDGQPQSQYNLNEMLLRSRRKIKEEINQIKASDLPYSHLKYM
jgi:biotin operon repressor